MHIEDHLADMPRYRSFRPTYMDPSGLALPDRQDWIVAPVSRNRDSGILDLSNFAACLAALGGESETVEIHRFGHWASGWFEIILVDPSDHDRAIVATELSCALADYPVLDEQDHSEREYEAACENVDQAVQDASSLIIDDPPRGYESAIHEWIWAHADDRSFEQDPESYSVRDLDIREALIALDLLDPEA